MKEEINEFYEAIFLQDKKEILDEAKITEKAQQIGNINKGADNMKPGEQPLTKGGSLNVTELQRYLHENGREIMVLYRTKFIFHSTYYCN